jgi:tetratricopeptide (TPR) repeat protein
VRENRRLWGDRYPGKLEERLALQQRIAQEVPEKLRLTLASDQKQALARVPTQNLKAHELYVQGRLAWNRRTAADLKQALDCFDQAIQRDPDYAQAYAGKADCYILLPLYALASRQDALPKAREAALQALRQDPTLGEAHIALAEVKFFFDWDFPGAESEFRRGLELKPTYPTGRQWYGEYLSCMGRHDAAIAELRQAKQLDPESLIIRCDLTGAYLFARLYGEAATECREALAKDRNYARARQRLGAVLARQDKYAEALAELEAADQLDPHYPTCVALLGYAYGSAGKIVEARRTLQRLKDLSQRREVWPVFFAYIHLALGEKDQALAELERGFRERSPGMVELIDPLFDPVRNEPRFQKIRADMKLPP